MSAITKLRFATRSFCRYYYNRVGNAQRTRVGDTPEEPRPIQGKSRRGGARPLDVLDVYAERPSHAGLLVRAFRQHIRSAGWRSTSSGYLVAGTHRNVNPGVWIIVPLRSLTA